jgi:hypothetical protein
MRVDSPPVPMDTALSRTPSETAAAPAANAPAADVTQVPLGFHNPAHVVCYFNSALHMLLSLPQSLLNTIVAAAASEADTEATIQQRQLTSSLLSLRRAYEASFAACRPRPQTALNAAPLLMSLMDDDELSVDNKMPQSGCNN